ncbi:MAG: enoyl-CoA hydratase/isomerase family protein [Acidobacteria bacterium]|nr:enoyl-CoA hydratase/isomerase family protein [Acidobacteriota bacterium]
MDATPGRPRRVFDGPTSIDSLGGPGWAWVGLRSGDGLNRLRTETLEALDRLFIALRWSGVRRLALSSAHWMDGRPGHLSAGADLHQVGALDSVAADPFSRRGQRVMSHLLWPGWESLTVLSGVAMGGGCDLALHGQRRWGVRGLKMAHPAARHGILTGFGGTARLPEVLGEGGAARLFRGFEHWDADQALQAGAVDRVLEAEELPSALRCWLSS